jgi:anti-anti-sigma factor
VTVQVSDADGVRVLVVEGELDVAVVPGLLGRVDELLGGRPSAVLDLSEVPFFDSSGVRLVDRLHRTCAAAGGRLVVAAPRGTGPRRVLEIVGMGGDLVADDVASALAAARGPRS